MPDTQKIVETNLAQEDGRWILFLRVVFGVLFLASFATAIVLVEQTQEHHKLSAKLRKQTIEYNDLLIEKQRLMIEQQAFSATPQVAQRAVNELGMFFPTGENRKIIMPQDNPMTKSSQEKSSQEEK